MKYIEIIFTKCCSNIWFGDNCSSLCFVKVCGVTVGFYVSFGVMVWVSFKCLVEGWTMQFAIIVGNTTYHTEYFLTFKLQDPFYALFCSFLFPALSLPVSVNFLKSRASDNRCLPNSNTCYTPKSYVPLVLITEPPCRLEGCKTLAPAIIAPYSLLLHYPIPFINYIPTPQKKNCWEIKKLNESFRNKTCHGSE